MENLIPPLGYRSRYPASIVNEGANITQPGSTFSLRSLFIVTLSIAIPFSLFNISPFLTLIAIPVSWALLLTYFSGNMAATNEELHTWLQNYTSGCIFLFIALVAVLYMSITYFPSNRRIALDAVRLNDIVRLKSVVSKIDRDENLDLLNDAAEYAGAEIIELLLENGWDPNHQEGHDNHTPLHRVVQYRNASIGGEIAKILIANGADPTLENAFGSTPEEEARFWPLDISPPLQNKPAE